MCASTLACMDMIGCFLCALYLYEHLLSVRMIGELLNGRMPSSVFEYISRWEVFVVGAHKLLYYTDTFNYQPINRYCVVNAMTVDLTAYVNTVIELVYGCNG